MSLLAYVSNTFIRLARYCSGEYRTARGWGKAVWGCLPVIFLCIGCSVIQSVLVALTNAGSSITQARSTSVVVNRPVSTPVVVSNGEAAHTPTQTAKPTETPKPTELPTATQLSNDFGKKVTRDDWSIIVDTVRRVNSLPWKGETINPDGTWIILIGKATSHNQSKTYIGGENFQLRVPGSTQTIKIDRDATGAAGLTMNVNSTVAGFAGLPIDGAQTLPFVVAFDVPAETKAATLTVDAAQADIHLGSVDIEAIQALPTIAPTAIPTATPAPTATTTPTPIPVVRVEAQVVEVVDGDTIKVAFDGRQETVRLIGVDAPETTDPAKPVECYGPEATEALGNLVQGRTVVLENDVSETDQYGRLLRYVFVTSEQGNELHVNWELVWNGYANAKRYRPDIRHQDEYTSAQSAARDTGRGFWNTATCNGSRIQPALVPPTPVPSTAVPAAPPAQATGPAKVVISYVMFDGAEYRSEGDEYAVIANKGGTEINLRGWLLNAGDRGQNFVFPGYVLSPGAKILVYTNRNLSDSFTFGRGSAIWANEGDCGSLYNVAGTLVSEYCY